MLAVMIRDVAQRFADIRISLILLIEHGGHKMLHNFLQQKAQFLQILLLVESRQQLVVELINAVRFRATLNCHTGQQRRQFNRSDSHCFQISTLRKQHITQKVIEKSLDLAHITETNLGKQFGFFVVEIAGRNSFLFSFVHLDCFVDSGLLKKLFLGLHHGRPFILNERR